MKELITGAIKKVTLELLYQVVERGREISIELRDVKGIEYLIEACQCKGFLR